MSVVKPLWSNNALLLNNRCGGLHYKLRTILDSESFPLLNHTAFSACFETTKLWYVFENYHCHQFLRLAHNQSSMPIKAPLPQVAQRPRSITLMKVRP